MHYLSRLPAPTSINAKKLLKSATNNFVASNFKEAFREYEFLLSLRLELVDPTLALGAEIGLLLCDLALDAEKFYSNIAKEYVLELYEIYLSKIEGKRLSKRLAAQKEFLKFLQEFDQDVVSMKDKSSKNCKTDKTEELEGITYKDFKSIIKDGADFKSAFMSLVYGAKIIFTTKEDFIDFINLLKDNNLEEFGAKYVEMLADYHDIFTISDFAKLKS